MVKPIIFGPHHLPAPRVALFQLLQVFAQLISNKGLEFRVLGLQNCASVNSNLPVDCSRT